MLERFAPHLRTVFLQLPQDVPVELADELRAKMRAVLTGRVSAGRAANRRPSCCGG